MRMYWYVEAAMLVTISLAISLVTSVRRTPHCVAGGLGLFKAYFLYIIILK